MTCKLQLYKIGEEHKKQNKTKKNRNYKQMHTHEKKNKSKTYAPNSISLLVDIVIPSLLVVVFFCKSIGPWFANLF
jgi:hypothetical protein